MLVYKVARNNAAVVYAMFYLPAEVYPASKAAGSGGGKGGGGPGWQEVQEEWFSTADEMCTTH